MNYDKIDTLLVVAGCRFEFLHGKDYEDFSPYKFAELIVKECAGIAASFSTENKRFHPDIYPGDMPMGRRMVYHSTCQSVAYEIKEHFGVEE